MYLKKLINNKQIIFTLKDLKKIWKIENPAYLRVVANRLSQRGEMIRLRRGVYVINKEYNVFELANKLKAPSYVSLETVLQKENIIFQNYGETFFSISNNTVSKKAGGKKFQYAKIANEILSNPLGIEIKNGFFVV